MRPYFSVGEEVILCSKKRPEFNGDYVVEKILSHGDFHDCRITGTDIKIDALGVGERFIYILDKALPSGIRTGRDAGVKESSLRKKHKPADQSFSELIKSTRELKA